MPESSGISFVSKYTSPVRTRNRSLKISLTRGMNDAVLDPLVREVRVLVVGELRVLEEDELLFGGMDSPEVHRQPDQLLSTRQRLDGVRQLGIGFAADEPQHAEQPEWDRLSHGAS